MLLHIPWSIFGIPNLKLAHSMGWWWFCLIFLGWCISHIFIYCIVFFIYHMSWSTHTHKHINVDILLIWSWYGHFSWYVWFTHISFLTHIDTHTHTRTLTLSLSLHSPIITYAMVIPSMSQGDERGGRTPLGWCCFHDGAALVMVWCWDTGRDKIYQQIMDI